MYSNLGNELQMNIIKDIVMIFTILGNDFLPRIETINTSRDIKNILNSYQELNQRIESDKDFKLIYRSDNLNNYQLDFETLTQFFINLKSNIKEYERYKRSKEWNLQPDQIININAIPFYRHIFNIENLANIYDTSNDIILPVNNKLINLICRKYLVGFIWLGNYYLNHNIDYEFFYYKYNNYPTPTINQLIYNLKIINKNPKMLYSNLEKSLSNSYFNRSEQLIFISPFNIIDIVDQKLLSPYLKKIANKYDEAFNKEILIEISDYKVNLFDYLNCSNADYLSKCKIKNELNKSGQQILKYLRD